MLSPRPRIKVPVGVTNHLSLDRQDSTVHFTRVQGAGGLPAFLYLTGAARPEDNSAAHSINHSIISVPADSDLWGDTPGSVQAAYIMGEEVGGESGVIMTRLDRLVPRLGSAVVEAGITVDALGAAVLLAGTNVKPDFVPDVVDIMGSPITPNVINLAFRELGNLNPP
ncbi:MAG TPA: hypothetical protein VLF71_04940, partial [Candidatus Saccharimonadales bacterium]|nr:hypothetical protein [Candidatus Saccharimonadales bacterium]